MVNKINIPEYSVTEFNKLFRDLIEDNFNYIRIRGELSEIKTATKGQVYLTLKDNDSIISGVIWENKKKFLKFIPELGAEVIVTGKITTWSRYKSTYQIDIENVDIAGEGALLKLIEDRKKKLKLEGLFDDRLKKEIPYIPSRIGIITSPTGSVIHDIINRLKERFPTNIDLWPVNVQGSEAANSIIKAIKGFNNFSILNKPEVIIIARGGGSTEDLMAFNDENLVREIFNSKIPIISAIGHETDHPIIDDVSDIRASTPTAAAEIVVPTKKELTDNIDSLVGRLEQKISNILSFQNDQLYSLSKFLRAPNHILKSYIEKFQSAAKKIMKELSLILEKKHLQLDHLKKIIKSPENNIILKKNEIKKLCDNLEKNLKIKKNQSNASLNDLSRLLKSNSINSNLEKGYTIISKSTKIIKRASELKNQDSVSLKFYDKKISVDIIKN